MLSVISTAPYQSAPLRKQSMSKYLRSRRARLSSLTHPDKQKLKGMKTALRPCPKWQLSPCGPPPRSCPIWHPQLSSVSTLPHELLEKAQ
ncbi:hypothetical protein QQF64_007308 [Cirrhinus molitorella]|uniref:Uncharacterized protein n=1 Tax=Cirrhinus molitorella TaxID=172907 RepID=A0ABR3MAD1_9TELE